MSVAEANAAMQHSQHAEAVTTLNSPKTRPGSVPCDAVAISGKLVQNNGIELCAPDRCCEYSRMNVLPE